jgi:predicted HTH domain antitoxin
MTQLTIPLPVSVTEAEAKLCLAFKLFETGRLSCGQGAAMAGLSKGTFMELLGREGIPVFDHAPDELTNDLNHA